MVRRVRRCQCADRVCGVFKPTCDTRYSDKEVVTHNQDKNPAISTAALFDCWDVAITFDCIGIDEGQFFPDLVEFCEALANQGKTVIVACLDATYQRKAFGTVLQLVPLAETVIKLKAVCSVCKHDASFTYRIAASTDEMLIGGADSYRAVCRACYFKA